jgi:excisionase family DNA binding protein
MTSERRRTPWGGRRYMSIEEVAEYFGVHPRTVHRMLTRHELSAIRVGRQWRIPIKEIEALEKRTSTKRYW